MGRTSLPADHQCQSTEEKIKTTNPNQWPEFTLSSPTPGLGMEGLLLPTVWLSVASTTQREQKTYMKTTDWVSCGFTSHPTQNMSFWRRSSQPISWLSTEKKTKTNTTKQTCIHNKIYYNIKWTSNKTKARFGHLLRPPDLKWRGPILVSALHKFVTYLLRHLPTYLQPRDPHRASENDKMCEIRNIWIEQENKSTNLCKTVDSNISSAAWNVVLSRVLPAVTQLDTCNHITGLILIH